MRLITGVFIILLAIAQPTLAQSQNAAQRRDELARIQERINDPDPMMRLANFEEIAAQGDMTKIQIAIRVAMSGNDRALRGLAFRAYLANFKRIQGDLAIDPALQRAFDAAGNDRRALRQLTANVRYLDRLIRTTGMRADFQITEMDMKTGRGTARVKWFSSGLRDFDFQVNGDRFIGTFGMHSVASNEGDCPIELRPTNDLQIVGQFVCRGTGFGAVKVIAPMF